MNSVLNFNYIIFSLPLLLLSYIIGIAITELLFLVTIIFFIFSVIKTNNLEYFNNKFFIFFIIISFYILFLSLFKINYWDLKISSIFYFRYPIISISLLYFLSNYEPYLKQNKKKLEIIIICFIFLITFDSIFQFFYGKNLIGFEIVQQNRITSFFREEIALGGYYLKLLPIILCFAFYYEFCFFKKKTYFIFFLGFFFITIYLSGSRSSLFLCILYITILSLFIYDIKLIFYKSLFLLSFFILLTSYFNLGKTNIFNRLFIKTFNQVTNQLYTKIDNRFIYSLSTQYELDRSNNSKINLFVTYLEKNSLEKIKEDILLNIRLIKRNLKLFSDIHQGHYILALKIFGSNPIFGSGPEGFRNYCRLNNYDPIVGTCTTHPHNLFLQILSELGIIGILLYLLGVIFIILKIFKATKLKKKYLKGHYNSFLVISFGLLLVYFPLTPSGNFFNNWISLSNFYYIGIYMTIFKKLNL